ncbi:kinase-like domain [Cordyceps militaris]|uniref:Kinase-like domain n=1 Tax=Cordyceps militaris TaxID=73501 RepID=A0A2H4S761_CORMI|nr:kinase-like domain [Cordyceps militaris]
MPVQQRPNIQEHSDFSVAALLCLAERLRGLPCECDTAQRPVFGAFNWAIFLHFQDGVVWVFRSPDQNSFESSQLITDVLASEVATMKLVREMTSIPVPEIFHYCADDKNDIGVPYILMSKANGVALSAYSWQERPLSTSEHKRKKMNREDKLKILHQLGRYSSQLSQLRFPCIGSIFESANGTPCIQQCLSPGHLFEGRDAIEEIPRGPFSSSQEFYASLVAALRLHAEQLPMGYHLLVAPIPIPQEYTDTSDYRLATDHWNDFAVLGGKPESSQNRLQYTMAAQFLLDSIIPLLAGESKEEISTSSFPLYHPDLSDQNIFIDDDFNITCIIDWAFSSTVPPAMLYATPGLPHARDTISDPLLQDAFHSGYTSNLATGNRPKPLPRDWKNGAIVTHFLRLACLDSLQDFHHFEALCGLALDKPFDLPETLSKLALTAEAVKLQQVLAADDDPEEVTRREENKYFQVVGPSRLTVARKLTLAYSRNARFIADHRAWKWVGAVYRSLEEPFVEEHEDHVQSLSCRVGAQKTSKLQTRPVVTTPPRNEN